MQSLWVLIIMQWFYHVLFLWNYVNLNKDYIAVKPAVWWIVIVQGFVNVKENNGTTEVFLVYSNMTSFLIRKRTFFPN